MIGPIIAKSLTPDVSINLAFKTKVFGSFTSVSDRVDCKDKIMRCFFFFNVSMDVLPEYYV